MKNRILLAVLMLSLIVVVLVSINLAKTPNTESEAANATSIKSVAPCIDGFLWDEEAGKCIKIEDRVEEFKKIRSMKNIPRNLDVLRSENAARMNRTRGNLKGKIPPYVPGGIGAGVTFKVGKLNAVNGASLTTDMAIYRNGLGGCPTDWIFTTATNRTDKTLEILGGYYSCAYAQFMVFDWSCSTTNPCGTKTTPSYVVSTPFSTMNSCYFRRLNDGYNHSHDFIRYKNSTTKLNTKPTWKNTAYLYNFCKGTWDTTYSHQFTGTQRNCSTTATTCGWWGPIIETFKDPDADIHEVVFKNTKLTIGATSYLLNSTYTNWTAPGSFWKVFHRTANYSWGAGKNTNN